MGNSVKWVQTALSYEEVDSSALLNLEYRVHKLEEAQNKLENAQNALKNSSLLDKMELIDPQTCHHETGGGRSGRSFVRTENINANEDPEGTIYFLQVEFAKWVGDGYMFDSMIPFILKKGSTHSKTYEYLHTNSGVRIQVDLFSNSLKATFFSRNLHRGLKACFRTIIKIKP